MHVLVQWALQTPRDWTRVPAERWRDLPRRPVPRDGELGGQDQVEGWLYEVWVQGVSFTQSDHVAVEPLTGGVRVYSWRDDLGDSTRHPIGSIWDFRDPVVSAGRAEVRQTCDLYSDRPDLAARGFRPWSEFPRPSEDIVRHGVWVSDAKSREHLAVRRPVSWHEWVIV